MKTLLTLVLLTCSIVAQERFVKPVDEAELDPSFLTFRTKLIDAIDRRDSAYIYSILDPKISLSFGGDSGIRDFKRIWRLHQKSSPFWEEFSLAIKNGGRFDVDASGKRSNLFYAPYTFTGFPDDLDIYDYAAIFGTDVNLRKEPSMKGQIITKLSYNIVKIEPETVPKNGRSEYPGWWRITTLGGLKGFVKKEYVRSSIDYRAGFEKKRGRWVMVAFIAGD